MKPNFAFTPSSVENELLVYAVRDTGHRASYLDLFASTLGLKPLQGPMDISIMQRLIAADQLLFATLDDEIFKFLVVALFRSLTSRHTVALFLRPQTCFSNRKLVFKIKLVTFSLVKYLPGLSIVTITPYSVAPHFRQVSNFGIHDPQLWDFHDGKRVRSLPSTLLSEYILRAACGRKVICCLGGLSKQKGLAMVAGALESDVTLSARVLLVAAGQVHSESRHEANIIAQNGGLLLDRKISDSELESLYGVADVIWCCYAPEYDQASGIYGRAVQLGLPTIVRKGSQIHHFSMSLSLKTIAVDFDSAADTVKAFNEELPSLGPVAIKCHTEKIGTWRKSALRSLKQAMINKK